MSEGRGEGSGGLLDSASDAGSVSLEASELDGINVAAKQAHALTFVRR